MSTGNTFFYVGSYYWRIKDSSAEKDYPKHIRAWYGVPPKVDAAFSGGNIKGKFQTAYLPKLKLFKTRKLVDSKFSEENSC